MKKVFEGSVLASIIFLVLGIVLITIPETAIALIANIIGGVLIVMGGIMIIRYFKTNDASKFNLLYGIITVVAGLIIIFNHEGLFGLIPLILGIWIIFNSAFKIQANFNSKAYKNTKGRVGLVIDAVILIIGILLVVNPFGGAIAIMKIVGILITIYSVLDIVEIILLKK